MKQKILLFLFIAALFLPCSVDAAVSAEIRVDPDDDCLTISYDLVAENGEFLMESMRITSEQKKTYEVMIHGQSYPMNEDIPMTNDLGVIRGDNPEYSVTVNNYPFYIAFDPEQTYVKEEVTEETEKGPVVTEKYYGFWCVREWTPGLIGEGDSGVRSSKGEKYELILLKTVTASSEDPSGPVVTPDPVDTHDPIVTPDPVATPEPAKPVLVKSISFVGPNKVTTRKPIQLLTQVKPFNASDPSLTWKSGNKKYAVVSKTGKVTAKKAGIGKSVIITATAKDGSGVKATRKITIGGAVKKIKLTGKSSMKAGSKLKIKAKIKAEKNADKKLKWKSSNKKFATVSAKGVVKAKKTGKGKKVRITAFATDGSKVKASKTIRIK